MSLLLVNSSTCVNGGPWLIGKAVGARAVIVGIGWSPCAETRDISTPSTDIFKDVHGHLRTSWRQPRRPSRSLRHRRFSRTGRSARPTSWPVGAVEISPSVARQPLREACTATSDETRRSNGIGTRAVCLDGRPGRLPDSDRSDHKGSARRQKDTIAR